MIIIWSLIIHVLSFKNYSINVHFMKKCCCLCKEMDTLVKKVKSDSDNAKEKASFGCNLDVSSCFEYLEVQKQWCLQIELARLEMGKVFLMWISLLSFPEQFLFLFQWSFSQNSFCYLNIWSNFFHTIKQSAMDKRHQNKASESMVLLSILHILHAFGDELFRWNS